MRKIAVINQKGGVGKTTSCCNVGAAIASTGQRVLMMDLDPQAHLSMHLGIDPYPDRASVYNVLTDNLPLPEATLKINDNLHLVPSNIDLAAAEMELVSVMGREVILRDALPEIEDQYDVLMMDCPPSLGVLTINGLAAANEVIIPLQPHFLALQGVGKLLETIELVQKRINPDLVVSGIILCMYEAGTRLAAEVSSDLTEFIAAARETQKPWSKANVYKTHIRRNIKLAESPGYGKTIFDYAPSSNGAKDYATLAAEVLGRDAIEVPSAVVNSPPTEEQPAERSEPRSPEADAQTEVPDLQVEGRMVSGPEDVVAKPDPPTAETLVNGSDAEKPAAQPQPHSAPKQESTPVGGRIPIQFEEAIDSDSEARFG